MPPSAQTSAPSDTGSSNSETIVEGLFRVDGDSVVLLAGRSASSGSVHFPRRTVCPYTGADDVEPVELSGPGRLWVWTTVRAAPPGYDGDVPYAIGVVDIDGLRVVGRLTGLDDTEPVEGLAMGLTAVEVPTDDGPRSVWAFTPAEATAP